jgi:hypothetical protein
MDNDSCNSGGNGQWAELSGPKGLANKVAAKEVEAVAS